MFQAWDRGCGVMQDGAVKSVGRVFEVLECFARLRTPLSATEIARRLGYPASSTAAILKSMVVLGYLGFDRATRSYFPTIRLPLLCGWIDSAVLGDVRLERLAEELRTATGETVIVAAQNDLESQYLAVWPGTFPVRFSASAGMTRPLCASGTGWVLLSAHSDAEIARIVQRLNRGTPVARRVDAASLVEQVTQVRQQGYAVSYGTVVPGSGVIAMLLPTPSQARSLAIGVGGPVERLQRSEAETLRRLRSAIRRHFHARGQDASVPD